jgi:hypothetical protein
MAGSFGLSERSKGRATQLDSGRIAIELAPGGHEAGPPVKAGTAAALIADHERKAVAGCAPDFHVLGSYGLRPPQLAASLPYEHPTEQPQRAGDTLRPCPVGDTIPARVWGAKPGSSSRVLPAHIVPSGVSKSASRVGKAKPPPVLRTARALADGWPEAFQPQVSAEGPAHLSKRPYRDGGKRKDSS